MCRVVKCRQCQKSTWAGCGQHKTQVLAGIPKSQICSCEKPATSGFLSRLFGGK